MDETKEVIINDKRFIIHKAPATVAYETAMKYMQATAEDKDGVVRIDSVKMDECRRALFRYIEVDLGDGRLVKLENDGITNQHVTDVSQLVQLQKEAVAVNFHFSQDENPSLS